MTVDFQKICYSIDRLKTKNEPIFIWFLGPSGSGKSFFLRKFVEFYKDTGTSAEYSDGAQMLREIKEDISQRHHRPTQEGFIVTNPKLDEIIAKKLADSIQNFQGDYCFIEFSGGKDKLKQRNLSYKRIDQTFHQTHYSTFNIYLHQLPIRHPNATKQKPRRCRCSR